jgi:hypothetical protein
MATPIAGRVTSYELTTGAKLNFDELIYLNSPIDLPMTLGVDAQNMAVVRKEPVDQTVFQWQDESLLVPRVQLAAAATTGDAAFTVAAGEALRFATGDTARVVKATGSEVIRITGVSNATITATRAYGGSTATNFASGDVMMGVGTALDEGSDPENFRSRDRDLITNYTEIYGPYKISMSRTEQQVSKYGVVNEWSKQVWNRQREIWMRLEQGILYGIKFNDAVNRRRQSGGLHYFIASNVDASTTSLTTTAIMARQQAAFNRGDVPSVLIVNPASLADLNDLTNTTVISTDPKDTMRGRARVSYIETEFGTTSIIRNRYVHAYHAFLIKPEGVIRRILQPMIYQQLAKTGDSDNAQIVMEEGLEVKGEQHMAMWTNLSTYTTGV